LPRSPASRRRHKLKRVDHNALNLFVQVFFAQAGSAP